MCFSFSHFSTEYSCALQRDILVQGRLYITKNYACFYANIFTWETTVIYFGKTELARFRRTVTS